MSCIPRTLLNPFQSAGFTCAINSTISQIRESQTKDHRCLKEHISLSEDIFAIV